MSTGLRKALEPLLCQIESLNESIQEYDRRIEKMAKETYPETALLKQVKGVGDLIATTYVLTIEDTHRFGKEVANQVAAPTETRTPNWHRATIAYQD